MARIKYVLNERRLAALEAQDLVLEATEGSDSESTVDRQSVPSASFMEEDVPKAAGAQSVL